MRLLNRSYTKSSILNASMRWTVVLLLLFIAIASIKYRKKMFIVNHDSGDYVVVGISPESSTNSQKSLAEIGNRLNAKTIELHHQNDWLCHCIHYLLKQIETKQKLGPIDRESKLCVGSAPYEVPPGVYTKLLLVSLDNNNNTSSDLMAFWTPVSNCQLVFKVESTSDWIENFEKRFERLGITIEPSNSDGE